MVFERRIFAWGEFLIQLYSTMPYEKRECFMSLQIVRRKPFFLGVVLNYIPSSLSSFSPLPWFFQWYGHPPSQTTENLRVILS
jgi:hypothetical protein